MILVAPETLDAEVAELRSVGLREAKRLRRRGRKFLPAILAPDTMPGDGQSVQFGVALLALDWKISASNEIMVIESIDTVVTAAPDMPDTTLAEELADWSRTVVEIGDSLNPRTCEEAVLEGMRAGFSA